MTIRYPPSPTLVAECDVRTVSWAQFVKTLRDYSPRLFLRLHPSDPSAAGRYLRQDLLVHEAEVAPLCHQITWHYGLRWSEVDNAWIVKRDHTVGELHRRLWHIANQTSGERLDYQRE